MVCTKIYSDQIYENQITAKQIFPMNLHYERKIIGEMHPWSDCLSVALQCYTDGEFQTYCQVSTIRRILVGNKIVDHSDVVGASPVGAAPTTSSFST